MSTKFIPFPHGAVRGPFRSNGFTQFAVQTLNGWCYFIEKGEAGWAENRARKSAEEFAKKVLAS